MSFPVNPTKVLRLFAPLWLLLAVSLTFQWDAWQDSPLLLAFVGGLPIVAAIAAAFVRNRWRLDLTPDALVHKTLGFTEVFEWKRMGPIELRPSPLPEPLLVRTFWFAYPTDAPQTLQERGTSLLGRRLLCVFGDQSAAETIEAIESWRRLNARPR